MSEKLQVVLAEHERVLWDLHKRMELDGQIFVVEMAYLGAMSALSITMNETEFGRDYQQYLWFAVCSFSSIFFSVVLIEHTNNIFHSHVAAQYLFRTVRAQILQAIGEHRDSNIMAWESYLFFKRRAHGFYKMMEAFGGRANIFLSIVLPIVSIVLALFIVYGRWEASEYGIAYAVIISCSLLHVAALWIYIESKREFAELARMVDSCQISFPESDAMRSKRS